MRTAVAAARRPRLPIVFGGLLIVWTVGWYSRGGSLGLLGTVDVCVLLALLVPRSLPGTARSAIWSAVLLTVVCLAANLARVLPPTGTDETLRAYQYDRGVTFALALAVTALFFRPGQATVTVIGAGCLPMIMLTLVTEPAAGGVNHDRMIVWGALGLLALAGQVQRLTRPRSAQTVPAGWSEGVARAVLTVSVLAVAGLLAQPTATAAHATRTWLFGLMDIRPPDRRDRDRSEMLTLAPPPAGLAGHVRPLLAIRAPSEPGYLREAVYTVYSRAGWKRAPDAGRRELAPSGPADGAAGPGPLERRFDLGPAEPGVPEIWAVRVLAPRRLSGFPLPGAARTLLLRADLAPAIDGDGLVSTGDAPLPDEFRVGVAPPTGASACPGEAPGTAAYLGVPPGLGSAVSNWVAACPGLSEAASPRAAIEAVTRHFRTQYDYSLDAAPGGGGDRLTAFMQARRGHCTLFASASALLLRAQGIPTRVVGGYLCTERHPLLGLWMARERNAHAWCEAWDVEEGRWQLVEATPAAAMPEAFARPHGVRLLVDALAVGWRALVEALRTANPLLAVASAGVWLYLRGRDLLATPAGMLLAGGAVVWFLLLRRRAVRRRQAGDAATRRRAELTAAMARLERRRVPAALRRRADEPWTHWLRRVADRLPPDRAAHLWRLTEQYQTLRYGPEVDEAQVRAWVDASRRSRPST